MGDLSAFVEGLFNKAAVLDKDLIRSLTFSEHTIELDYRGRYVFELLQNARDAAKAANEKAMVKMILRNDALLIFNNGKPFTEEGITGICRIGLSTKKDDAGFIGHKGLGFKAVLEVSETPRIVTRSGTVYFDREAAHARLARPELKPKELPLFFMPLYDARTLADYEGHEGFSTLIILPFRAKVDRSAVLKDLEQLKPEFFPLLGHFKSLEIINEAQRTRYEVDSPDAGYCEVTRNGKLELALRIFEHSFLLTPEQIEGLPDEEKEMVDGNIPLEIKIGLPVRNGVFQPVDKAPLFLYYPLEEKSGFRFIIHSHFVVTPNRKSLLTNSGLNRLILAELQAFMVGVFLDRIKSEWKAEVPQILAFTGNQEGTLIKYGFYDKVGAALRNAAVIWNEQAGRFLSTRDFYLLNAEQDKVFTDPRWGEHYLVFYPSKSIVYQWLAHAMKARILGKDQLLVHIEEYSKVQLDRKDWNYFNRLYHYLHFAGIEMRHKRILVTEQSLLLDSKSEVYYGGQRAHLKLPPQLENDLTFMHPEIRLDNIRATDKHTGAVEFNTERLSGKAIRMFEEKPELRPGLLLLLRHLHVGKLPSDRLLRTILVPIVGQEDWVSPLFSPVYWPASSLLQLFPDGNFVDTEMLEALDPDMDAWRTWLLSCNVWESPALYIKESNTVTDPEHLKLLNAGNMAAVELQNDYVLHMPGELSELFSELIMTNWGNYMAAIVRFAPWPVAWGRKQLDAWGASSFIFQLKASKWIFTDFSGRVAWRPDCIYVLPVQEESYNQFRVLKKYFPVLFLADAGNSCLLYVGAIRLRSLNAQTALGMFRMAQLMYPDPPQETDFASAFNRLYGFFFDFYKGLADSEKQWMCSKLKTTYLLAEILADNKKKWAWQLGADILYVDDKPLLDKLPPTVQAGLPAQFTKRDRNEIGMVLNRVGIVLSQKVHKKLLPPSMRREHAFFDYLHWVHYTLPLIEQVRNSQLDSGQLQALKGAQVVLTEALVLSVNISAGNGRSFQQPIPHFIQKIPDGGFRLMLNEDICSQSDQVLAVHEFFEDFFNMELNLIFQFKELNRAATGEEALRILDTLDIDIVRVSELKEFFEGKLVTVRTVFWNTVAEASGCQALIEEDAQIDGLFDKIIDLLPDVSREKLVEYNERIDPNRPWTTDTLVYIRECCIGFAVDIGLLEKRLAGWVDVAKINSNELEGLIRRNRPSFVGFIYHALQTMDSSARECFLEWINEFEHPLNMDYQSLTFDANAVFLVYRDVMAQRTVGKQFEHCLTDNEGANRTELEIYMAGLKELKGRLGEQHLDTGHLEPFLEGRGIKSLLCFDVDQVLDLYMAFLKERAEVQDTANGAGPSTEPAVNDNEIEVEQPRRPAISPAVDHTAPNNRGGYKGGKRPPQTILDEIGWKGEYYVFRKLKQKYPSAKWVSVNAEKRGYAITGNDSLGYDIEYVDENEVPKYVEVKSTAGNQRQFNISILEVNTGIRYAEDYAICFVTQALDPQLTRAVNLGPVFKDCRSIDDFLNTGLFDVQASNFLVSFIDAGEMEILGEEDNKVA